MDELIDTDVQIVYSHPQPIGQCKLWISKNLPNAEIVLVDSTSAAAKLAKKDKNSAAIASHLASELYHLNSLETHIEDFKQNMTRFILIGLKKSNRTGNDKTSIVCSIKDNAGGLLSLLQPFSDLGINMMRIESRPDKKKMWEYLFFIDFAGHIDDELVVKALSQMKDKTIFLKILGSYPIDRL